MQEVIACEKDATVQVEGVAEDVTSPSTREKSGRQRYVRVGSTELSLSHEALWNWPMALRLELGQRYRCEVFKCKVSKDVTRASLPRDEVTQDGIVFYAVARAVPDRPDFSDRRRKLRNIVSAWTDGLAVMCCNQEVPALVPGNVYKTVVQRLPSL